MPTLKNLATLVPTLMINGKTPMPSYCEALCLVGNQKAEKRGEALLLFSIIEKLRTLPDEVTLTTDELQLLRQIFEENRVSVTVWIQGTILKFLALATD